ncbi:MAG: P-loop NTPase [Balneolaceae bacterium]
MNQTKPSNQPFILTITSGKGGVGKSMCSINIAELLGRSGYRVALIDADVGLSNCATFLNESVNTTIIDWIEGDVKIEDLLLETDWLTLVTTSDKPGAHSFQPELLMNALDQVTLYLMDSYDFIIIDTPAGAGEITLWALDRADLSTVVLVDEPAAISDVYRLCKYVFSIDPGYRFASIVNFAKYESSAVSTHKRFNHILEYFLNQQIAYLGYLPYSDEIRKTIQNQETLSNGVADPLILSDLEFITMNIISYANKAQKEFNHTLNQL